MSLVEIKCPMCKGAIWLDPSTGRVVDHQESGRRQASFDEFLKTQGKRGSQLEEQFKKAQEESVKRKEQMERQFKRAKDRPDELKGDVESPFDWD
ncbi:MAG: hypothetical protein GF344_17145 [Chitinivibrionales bacterium]|nr:hypothetical protein [Chitinivibrionales bacterium]